MDDARAWPTSIFITGAIDPAVVVQSKYKNDSIERVWSPVSPLLLGHGLVIAGVNRLSVL